ncbi:hypothetical protein ACET3Z_026674 [Daucus carota]
MNPAGYHPGSVNGNLLTLQDSHRSTFVWNSSEAFPALRVRTNFGEYWNVVAETRPPQSIMDAIKDAGFEKMCDSTHKVATGFIGYATLVQMWIYERFPTLAPRHTVTPLITYPLALRFVICYSSRNRNKFVHMY